jgi:hypothetical protein
MLVWDAHTGPQIVLTTADVALSCDVRSMYESYLCSVNRIIARESEWLMFVPNKLSAAMIGAFMAVGGRVAHCIETSYAQWHQFVLCAVHAIARGSRTVSTQPMVVPPIRAVRRVKAFFVAQKVDGHNAP